MANGSAEPALEQTTDLASVMERLDLTETGVRRWLEKLGATRQGLAVERLLAVAATGELLMERAGERFSVRVDAEMDDLLRSPQNSIVLVHNHPTNLGLSRSDMRHLAKPGVAAMVAIGHDGSVFIASAGPRMDRVWFADRQYPVAHEEVVRRIRLEHQSGRLVPGTGDAHINHLVTMALAKAGILDYRFEIRGSRRRAYDGSAWLFDRIVAAAAERFKSND